MFSFDFNDIHQWLLAGQFLSLVLAVVFILMQNRGAGLSGSFGGSDEIYLTRRGIEKSVVNFTIICIAAFVFFRIAIFYVEQPEVETEDLQNTEQSQIEQEMEGIDLESLNNSLEINPENIQTEENPSEENQQPVDLSTLDQAQQYLEETDQAEDNQE
jgi:protein translocase SecG subunit